MQHRNEVPEVGARCVAGPAGRWASGKVCRANEDGTFVIQFDKSDLELMPYCYGVTRSELSFNEADQSDVVFRKINPSAGAFGKEEFQVALARLGYKLEEDRVAKLWDHVRREVGAATATNLDSGSTY